MTTLDTGVGIGSIVGVMDTPQRYTLSASYEGKTVTVYFYDDDDNDATFTAIGEVLNRSCPKVGEKRTAKHTVWAKGLIVLTDSEGNEVRRMEARV